MTTDRIDEACDLADYWFDQAVTHLRRNPRQFWIGAELRAIRMMMQAHTTRKDNTHGNHED
jgi:hypothetical protein